MIDKQNGPTTVNRGQVTTTPKVPSPINTAISPAPKETKRTTGVADSTNQQIPYHWSDSQYAAMGANAGAPKTPSFYPSTVQDLRAVPDVNMIYNRYGVASKLPKGTAALDPSYFSSTEPLSLYDKRSNRLVVAANEGEYVVLLYNATLNGGLDYDHSVKMPTQTHSLNTMKEQEGIGAYNLVSRMLDDNVKAGLITDKQRDDYRNNKKTLEEINAETGYRLYDSYAEGANPLKRINAQDYYKWDAEIKKFRTGTQVQLDQSLQEFEATQDYLHWYTDVQNTSAEATARKEKFYRPPKKSDLDPNWQSWDSIPESYRTVDSKGNIAPLPPGVSYAPKGLLVKIETLRQQLERELSPHTPTGYAVKVSIPDLTNPEYEIHFIDPNGIEFGSDFKPVDPNAPVNISFNKKDQDDWKSYIERNPDAWNNGRLTAFSDNPALALTALQILYPDSPIEVLQAAADGLAAPEKPNAIGATNPIPKWEDLSVDQIKSIVQQGGPELEQVITNYVDNADRPFDIFGIRSKFFNTDFGRSVLAGIGVTEPAFESALQLAGLGNGGRFLEAVERGEKLKALAPKRTIEDISFIENKGREGLAPHILKILDSPNVDPSVKEALIDQNFIIHWDKVSQPGYLPQVINMMGESGPSSLPLMIAGMAMVALTGGKNPTVWRTMFSSITAGVTTSFFESLLEAASTYVTLRTQGINGQPLSNDLSRQLAQTVFLKNMVMLSGSNSIELFTAFIPGGATAQTATKGFLNKAGEFGKKAAKTVGIGVAVGAQSGYEEVLQQAISNDAQGIPFDKWDTSLKESFVLGFLMGFPMGAGGQIITNVKENAERRLQVQAQDNAEVQSIYERFNQVYEDAQRGQSIGASYGSPINVDILDEISANIGINEDAPATTEAGWQLYRDYKQDQRGWTDEQKNEWQLLVNNSPELSQAITDLEVATDANIGSAWNTFSQAYQATIDKLNQFNDMASSMGAAQGQLSALDWLASQEGGPEIIRQATVEANNQYVHNVVQESAAKQKTEKKKSSKKPTKTTTKTDDGGTTTTPTPEKTQEEAVRGQKESDIVVGDVVLDKRGNRWTVTGVEKDGLLSVKNAKGEQANLGAEGVRKSETVEIDKQIEAKQKETIAALDAALKKRGNTLGTAGQYSQEDLIAIQKTSELASLYIKRGVATIEEFLSHIGYELNDLIQKGWDRARKNTPVAKKPKKPPLPLRAAYAARYLLREGDKPEGAIKYLTDMGYSIPAAEKAVTEAEKAMKGNPYKLRLAVDEGMRNAYRQEAEETKQAVKEYKVVTPASPVHVPKQLDTIMGLVDENKGLTFNFSLGLGDLFGTKRYSVGVFTNDTPVRALQLKPKQFTKAAVEKFMSDNADILSDPRFSLGIWDNQVRPDNKSGDGLFYLDIVATPDNELTTHILGQETKQQTAFNLEKGITYEIAYRGEKNWEGKKLTQFNAQMGEKILAQIDNPKWLKADDWDARARNAMQRLVGDEWKTMARVLAATSPNSSTDKNWIDAARAMEHLLLKIAFDPNDKGFNTNTIANIERAYMGDELSGRKIRNWAKNLLGSKHGGDDNAITIDVWMMRAFGFIKDVPNNAEYDMMEEYVKKLASGWRGDEGQPKAPPVTGSAMQARIWTIIRGSESDYLSAFEKDTKTNPVFLESRIKQAQRIRNMTGQELREFADLLDIPAIGSIDKLRKDVVNFLLWADKQQNTTNKDVSYSHYSTTQGLTELSPEYMGTGAMGEEGRLLKSMPDVYQKHTNLYGANSPFYEKPEAVVGEKGKYKYEGSFPQDKVLSVDSPEYDALRDKAAAVVKKGGVYSRYITRDGLGKINPNFGGNVELVRQELTKQAIEAGYQAIDFGEGDLRGIVPHPVTEASTQNAKSSKLTEIDTKINDAKGQLSDLLKAAGMSHTGLVTSGYMVTKEDISLYKVLFHLAELYIQKGVLTAQEFAKQAQLTFNDTIQSIWDKAVAGDKSEKISPELAQGMQQILALKAKELPVQSPRDLKTSRHWERVAEGQVETTLQVEQLKTELGLPKETNIPQGKRVLSESEKQVAKDEIIKRLKAARGALEERKGAVKELRGRQTAAGMAAKEEAGGGLAGYIEAGRAQQGMAEKTYLGMGKADFDSAIIDYILNTPDEVYKNNPAVFYKSRKGEYWTVRDAQTGLLSLIKGETLPQAQLKHVENVYGIEFIREIKNTPKDLIMDVLSIPKSLMAFLDHSFPGRQGWIINSANPEIAWQNIKDATGSFWNEGYFESLKKRVIEDPNFQKSADYGVDYTDTGLENAKREESYPSRILDFIPGMKQSNRSFTWAANAQRLDAWNKYSEWLGPNATPEELSTLASFINKATGRGDLGNLKTFATELNTILFSPKLFMARLQVPLMGIETALPTGVRAKFGSETPYSARMQRIYWRNVGTSIGVTLTTMALLKGLSELPDLKDKIYVETDLRSSDIGKVIIGDTHIDLTGGNGQLVYLLARMATGTRKSGGSNEYDTTGAIELQRYLRYKGAPPAAIAMDWAVGKDVLGEKFGTGKYWLGKIPAPMSIMDTIDAVAKSGLGGLAVLPLVTYGGSANTYEPRGMTEEKRLGTPKYSDEELMAAAVAAKEKYTKPGQADALGQKAVDAQLDKLAADTYTLADYRTYLRTAGLPGYKLTALQQYFVESIPLFDKWQKDEAATGSKQIYTTQEKERAAFWGLDQTASSLKNAAKNKLASLGLPQSVAPWLFGKPKPVTKQTRIKY